MTKRALIKDYTDEIERLKLELLVNIHINIFKYINIAYILKYLYILFYLIY